MRQYQKNGKMTMRLRSAPHAPATMMAGPGMAGGIEAAVAVAGRPGGITWPIKRSMYDKG